MPRASEVAAALGRPLRGPDVAIVTPCAVDDAGPGALVFLSRANEATLARLNSIGEVACAALAGAHVEDEVKTDDHVHIAHNTQIGARVFIAAGAVISGSVTIGRDAWIGPNATISDYVTIGARARVGIGSLVMKPVEPGVTVFGNPARKLKTNTS